MSTIETLAGIVLGQLDFLGNTEEPLLDQRIAVKQLEAIAADLRTLDPDGRAAVLAVLEKMAAETLDREHAASLRALGSAVFPTEEEEGAYE